VESEIEILTARVARGDEPAIAAFYRRFFALLYHTARQVTRRDESFCLDVVQEALLRVVRTLRPLASEAQLAAWLRLVVKTVAYDLLRAEARRKAREAEAGRAARMRGYEGTTDASSDAVEEVDETEARLEWLRGELAAFDPGIVRLIELRFVEGWTLARVGAALGLTAGAVDGRLRRAIRELRRRGAEVRVGALPHSAAGREGNVQSSADDKRGVR
jgi:RNA polymerase sigma factor (sigma-70 family)